jgi:ferredoxin--NADP+ reductase
MDGGNGAHHPLFDTDVLKDRLGVEMHPDKVSVFLCGNPAMIEDVKKVLEPKGFKTHSLTEQGSLHIEEYW